MDTNGNIKEILIKDLCSRLPYGVKVSKVVEDWISDPRPIRSINLNNIIVEDGEFEDGTPDIDVWAYEDFKPYIFPLSSMTEEQRREQEAHFICIKHDMSFSICRYMEWCYKNHLDVNGLIPKGLAIDATGKNIY